MKSIKCICGAEVTEEQIDKSFKESWDKIIRFHKEEKENSSTKKNKKYKKRIRKTLQDIGYWITLISVFNITLLSFMTVIRLNLHLWSNSQAWIIFGFSIIASFGITKTVAEGLRR